MSIYLVWSSCSNMVATTFMDRQDAEAFAIDCAEKNPGYKILLTVVLKNYYAVTTTVVREAYV